MADGAATPEGAARAVTALSGAIGYLTEKDASASASTEPPTVTV